jgi:hypothetical protein
VNQHEYSAWRVLLELGARITQIATKHALDLRPIRITSKRKLALFCQAFNEVAGRSGTNRRHQDRTGCPIYVVTDDAAPPLKKVR